MKSDLFIGQELLDKKENLKKIKVDNINWLGFYIDELSNEKWVEEYPQSEMQGGGPSQLRLIREFPWGKSEKNNNQDDSEI